MRLLLVLAAFSALAVFTVAASGASGVQYVGHDKVSSALGKSGSPALVSASDLLVQGSHRDKAGQVEVHDKETDVIYVIDGDATFVTGGTMIGGKVTKAGQSLGTDIQGGDTHHLSKGDVIVVPAGVPHWFKDVPHSVSYYVVKVLKP